MVPLTIFIIYILYIRRSLIIPTKNTKTYELSQSVEVLLKTNQNFLLLVKIIILLFYLGMLNLNIVTLFTFAFLISLLTPNCVINFIRENKMYGTVKICCPACVYRPTAPPCMLPAEEFTLLLYQESVGHYMYGNYNLNSRNQAILSLIDSPLVICLFVYYKCESIYVFLSFLHKNITTDRRDTCTQIIIPKILLLLFFIFHISKMFMCQAGVESLS